MPSWDGKPQPWVARSKLEPPSPRDPSKAGCCGGKGGSALDPSSFIPQEPPDAPAAAGRWRISSQGLSVRLSALSPAPSLG